MALFLYPERGDWVFRALRGGGVQRLALLPGKGGILFPKRIPPLEPPEKGEGTPLDPAHWQIGA